MRNWMHELESGYDPKDDQHLSKNEATSFRRAAVDGNGYDPIDRRRRDNEHLTNSELVSRIESRIAAGQPIARLMDEYNRRL